MPQEGYYNLFVCRVGEKREARGTEPEKGGTKLCQQAPPFPQTPPPSFFCPLLIAARFPLSPLSDSIGPLFPLSFTGQREIPTVDAEGRCCTEPGSPRHLPRSQNCFDGLFFPRLFFLSVVLSFYWWKHFFNTCPIKRPFQYER